MVQVTILETLKDEILKKFKEESRMIFRQMHSLAKNPHKGKSLGHVGGIVIKELKCQEPCAKAQGVLGFLSTSKTRGSCSRAKARSVRGFSQYKNFRFYFITDGYKLKIMDESKLVDLLIRFIRMSDKKNQQQTLDEIRRILLNFGPEGFG